MLMNEVREKTGLTRKAIEYYEEKDFIHPKREENNYRLYSDEDVEVLRKIAIYRKLGCSVEEIKLLLKGEDKTPLASIIRDREIKSNLENNRVEALKGLLEGSTLDQIKEELDMIEKEETIYSKLTRAFPGYLGQMYFLSYKPFLNERLDEDKLKYYEEFIEFIDNMPELDLTEEEKNILEKSSQQISTRDIEEINEEKIKVINNVEKWLEENKELIDDYQSFKESEIYKNNPIYKIQEKTKKHMEESGYYDLAIPLIRKFSPSYDAYYRKLLEANDKFLQADS